ncbi:minor capsid protein [Equus caballus papillomavirus 1]|uniref:Minor capsid protein L2 n=1 Tax=Equus caballus papillomavirus 1 (strain Olson) TaxID=654918 RepID=Q8QQB7_ECPVO|nr:minor capsid protein [Equus caballus papillomavirus 1]AAM19224.1 minor capsid protein [Equus caballus papillomavirus 1]
MSASHGVLTVPRRTRVRRAVRRPRASVQDLYPTCRTGDCPPDVVNKVEGTTLADKLLQWLSSFIYLGNLGIGTGRGGGGRFGYTPVGRPSGPEGGVRVARPSITIDPLGAADVIPLDTLGPDAPAIVPLSEVVETDLGAGAGGLGEVPETELTSGGAPVLDTTHTWLPPGSEGGFTATFPNPSFDGDVISGPSNSDPVVRGDVFVTGDMDVSVGREEWELDIFSGPGPSTSTPDPSVRVSARTRGGLTGRQYEQIELQDLAALGGGGNRESYAFDNPVFDSGSVEFAVDYHGDPPFQDLQKLGPVETYRSSRGVSVSRVGHRGTMSTRSGRNIGAQVHYFHILSSIAPEESLVSGPVSGRPGEDAFEEISLTSFPSLYSESELLDEEVIEPSGHLVIGSGRESRPYPTEVMYRPPVVTFDLSFEQGIEPAVYMTPKPPHGSIPGIIILVDSPDTSGVFDLHPSLLRRRKRRYMWN